MSDQIKDGGSAFPQVRTNAETVGSGGDYQTYGNVESFGGLSLRDYFAAKALQGAMVNANGLGGLPDEERAALFNGCARLCYEASDAMLRARGDA